MRIDCCNDLKGNPMSNQEFLSTEYNELKKVRAEQSYTSRLPIEYSPEIEFRRE